MKRDKKSTMIAGLGLCAVLAAALSGCGSLPQAGAGQQGAGSTAAVGSILLSVNPEIEVAYDARGKVVEVEGVNDDGRSVVGGYDGYEGRDTGAVMGELVHEISDDGYFDGGINGHERNIVLKMADGSSAPSDDFMEQVADSVRTAASGCGLTSSAYALDRDDLDDSGLIGVEAAKEIVLGQLGIDPASASFRDHEYELDDGVYELEFVYEGVEYDYEVDARTGKVLEADLEGNDDWDDRDLWDDDDADDAWDDDADDAWDDDDDRSAHVIAPAASAPQHAYDDDADDWDDDGWDDDGWDDDWDDDDDDDDWDDDDDDDDWDDDDDDDWDDDGDDDDD